MLTQLRLSIFIGQCLAFCGLITLFGLSKLKSSLTELRHNMICERLQLITVPDERLWVESGECCSLQFKMEENCYQLTACLRFHQ